MLGKLFGSNARVKILKLFLLNPDKKYYIRQIARDLGLQLNSVSRELENLESFGLLISNPAEEKKAAPEADSDFMIQTVQDIESGKSRKKNIKTKEVEQKTDKKYFQVNKNFVLFEEIKALIIKSQVLYEKDFVKNIQKIGKIKLLVLTGFFVNRMDMAVDLFLVGRVNKIKLVVLIKELQKELGREINFTVMDISEFMYRRDITDIFLYDILEAKKITIIDEIGINN